jgi:hypothetical protein
MFTRGKGLFERSFEPSIRQRSFQSQAVIPGDQIRSRDYIAVCRRSGSHGWGVRIEVPSTPTSAGKRSYVYGSDAFLPDYNGAHEWR